MSSECLFRCFVKMESCYVSVEQKKLKQLCGFTVCLRCSTALPPNIQVGGLLFFVPLSTVLDRFATCPGKGRAVDSEPTELSLNSKVMAKCLITLDSRP